MVAAYRGSVGASLCQMIRAAIFDLDGTLVDSNDLPVQAWQETFRHFGMEIPSPRLREQIGKGGDQYLPVFLNDKKLARVEELVDSQTTMDDVAHSKPKADVFIAALRTLGNLPPEQAIAIGDTWYDVEAAKKINLSTIALLCGDCPEDDLRDVGACAIFRDAADLLDRYYQSPLAG